MAVCKATGRNADYDMDADAVQTAEQLGRPVAKAQAALNYAAAFLAEIDTAIRDNEAVETLEFPVGWAVRANGLI